MVVNNPQTGLYDFNYNASAVNNTITNDWASSASNPINVASTGLADWSNNAYATPNTSTTSINPNITAVANQVPTGTIDPTAIPKDTTANWFGEGGMANTAITGANALANSWLGFENLGVAKDQYALQKTAYNDQKTAYDESMVRKANALANS